jgi:4-carboxymuconolactone decarboxylase
MKKNYWAIAILLLLFSNVKAQPASIFPKGELSKPVHNNGNVWLHELAPTDSILKLSLAHATFAPNAKLDWHYHPAGQYLLITEGTGYYQERGKAVQTVSKGDVVKCMPNVEHWHGAVPGSSFAYIGVTPTHNGKTVWLKPVTDDEYNNVTAPVVNNKNAEEEIISLSKTKWQWMADKNVDTLAHLFHDKSMFVHMGGSWGKEQEINVIKSGGIHYKKAEVYSVTVNIIGNTAILLNDIDLVAVVGGNEVTNPFMVTEVYINETGNWKMGSLTFSKLMRAVKMN